MKRLSCFVVVSFDAENEAQAESGVESVDSVLDYVRGAVEETGGKSVSVVLDAVEETDFPRREKSTLGDGFLPSVRILWTASDVQALRPGWSLQRCADFLDSVRKPLADRSTEIGWTILEGLLDSETA